MTEYYIWISVLAVGICDLCAFLVLLSYRKRKQFLHNTFVWFTEKLQTSNDRTFDLLYKLDTTKHRIDETIKEFRASLRPNLRRVQCFGLEKEIEEYEERRKRGY